MFKITIENMNRTNAQSFIENKSFETKKEANKFKRAMVKAYELMNHGGYIVNYSSQTELFTNY